MLISIEYDDDEGEIIEYYDNKPEALARACWENSEVFYCIEGSHTYHMVVIPEGIPPREFGNPCDEGFMEAISS